MKKHSLFIPILASLVLGSCGGNGGDTPTPTPTPEPEIINPTNISLSASSLSLIEGESETITATVTPENATDKTVTWSVSEGNEYITVNGGVITAVKAGRAVVSAKTVNNLTATCSVSVTAAIIDPVSVSLSESSMTIVNGESKQLTATVLPENATNKSVTWSVIAGSAVSVDETGLVSAKNVGTAVVQAKTINDKYATCNVTVVAQTIDPTGVTLNESEVNLVNGESKQLTATVAPNNATDKSVTWSVTSGSAVTVDENGLVNATNVGEAVVTVSTINGKTASCNFNVTAAYVEPTDVTISDKTLNLEFGGSATLSATVTPSDATDKSVTYSVIQGEDVVSVNATTGVVKALKQGSAKVQVSTVNSKTDVCDVTVAARHIKGYVNEDKHSLIVGNPLESVAGGEFVEVKNISETSVPCYNFTYGATVKFNVQTVGYYEPTGLKVNNVSYSVNEGAVTFVAEVEDPDDPIFNLLDIEVTFKDNTPLVGDYEIVTTESTHISLVYTYAVNGQETKACSQGDKIIITPVITDSDYEVKAITGYTYYTNDTILKKEYFAITDNGDGTYYFITPFSHEAFKTIWIEVTEVNSSLFKGSELVGDYAVIRTYGLSENSGYINEFEKNNIVTFSGSGEITYKSIVGYASSAEDGIVNTTFGTSSVKGYYGKNILVFGQSGSGGQMITPLTQDSTDLVIAVKTMPGMLINDIEFDNFVFKINGNTYGVFNFYYGVDLYASCYTFVDKDGKANQVITDTSVVQYFGSKLNESKTVFEVFDKDDNSLIHVGYYDVGGYGNYLLISNRTNGYTDLTHSLLFINDNNAIYDDYTCTITGTEPNIVLDAPTRHIEITLDPSTLTFVVTEEHEVVPKTLDIANKVFTGKDDDSNTLKMTFGPSNSSITGSLTSGSYIVYRWDFTGVFDPNSNMLIITITNVCYYYSHTPDNLVKYSDYSLGKERRIAISDKTLTFLDNISGISSSFPTKDCSVTCDDFHFGD